MQDSEVTLHVVCSLGIPEINVRVLSSRLDIPDVTDWLLCVDQLQWAYVYVTTQEVSQLVHLCELQSIYV